jgi:hypothetical protein
MKLCIKRKQQSEFHNIIQEVRNLVLGLSSPASLANAACAEAVRPKSQMLLLS